MVLAYLLWLSLAHSICSVAATRQRAAIFPPTVHRDQTRDGRPQASPHSPSPTARLTREFPTVCRRAATTRFSLPRAASTFVDIVRADRDRPDGFAFKIKSGSQVCRYIHGVDREAILSGEPVDFVGSESRIERFLFENLKRLPGGPLLIQGKLAPTAPESFCGAEPIVHLSAGNGSLSAVSKSTTRPAAMSSMPCLNSSGIHESSVSTTNLVTCARSAGGRCLICSMISCALTKRNYCSAASFASWCFAACASASYHHGCSAESRRFFLPPSTAAGPVMEDARSTLARRLSARFTGQTKDSSPAGTKGAFAVSAARRYFNNSVANTAVICCQACTTARPSSGCSRPILW